MIVKLSITSTEKVQCINITDRLNQLIRDNNFTEGILFIYAPHTTAALTINEGFDPDVFRDIVEKVDHLIPQSFAYHHQEGNSEAHIKSALIGNQRFLFVRNHQMVKGCWEGIFFMEFDGPRNRQVLISFLPNK
jgi:secondary thiamine-phosphate synthase enzyme